MTSQKASKDSLPLPSRDSSSSIPSAGVRSRLPARIPYDIDADEAAGLAAVAPHSDVEITEQHHAANLDMNVLIQKFRMGHLPMPDPVGPEFFQDISHAADLRSVLDQGRRAREYFESLPAPLREKFANDPIRMVQFAINPQNEEEAVQLGILKRDKPPEPVRPTQVVIVDPEGNVNVSHKPSKKEDK